MLSLCVFAVVLWSVPAVRLSKTTLRGAMSAILGSRALLAVFGATALVVTGNFLAYTYIAPYLEQIARQSPADTSVMLLLYGAAGVLANFAITPFAARSLRASLAIVTAVLAASLAAMHLAVGSYGATAAMMVLWGAAYGALPVLLQTSVFNGAARIEGGADAATSINVAVFNAAIGLGALVGGLLINGAGPVRIPAVAGAFVLAGLVLVAAGGRGRARER
jgi:predicted MFS family arabinose efflux permease